VSIALRKRALSPIRLVLEIYQYAAFLLFVGVIFTSWEYNIIESNVLLGAPSQKPPFLLHRNPGAATFWEFQVERRTDFRSGLWVRNSA
jgi:hypothetical protein